jgi:hypothetical protein
MLIKEIIHVKALQSGSTCGRKNCNQNLNSAIKHVSATSMRDICEEEEEEQEQEQEERLREVLNERP